MLADPARGRGMASGSGLNQEAVQNNDMSMHKMTRYVS